MNAIKTLLSLEEKPENKRIDIAGDKTLLETLNSRMQEPDLRQDYGSYLFDKWLTYLLHFISICSCFFAIYSVANLYYQSTGDFVGKFLVSLGVLVFVLFSVRSEFKKRRDFERYHRLRLKGKQVNLLWVLLILVFNTSLSMYGGHCFILSDADKTKSIDADFDAQYNALLDGLTSDTLLIRKNQELFKSSVSSVVWVRENNVSSTKTIVPKDRVGEYISYNDSIDMRLTSFNASVALLESDFSERHVLNKQKVNMYDLVWCIVTLLLDIWLFFTYYSVKKYESRGSLCFMNNGLTNHNKPLDGNSMLGKNVGPVASGTGDDVDVDNDDVSSSGKSAAYYMERHRDLVMDLIKGLALPKSERMTRQAMAELHGVSKSTVRNIKAVFNLQYE